MHVSGWKGRGKDVVNLSKVPEMPKADIAKILPIILNDTSHAPPGCPLLIKPNAFNFVNSY